MSKRYSGFTPRRQSVRLARNIYRLLFSEELPRGWRIEFGTLGVCNYDSKTIYIANEDVHDGLKTLIHEFIHQRHPDWTHNARWDREEQRLLKQLIGVV